MDSTSIAFFYSKMSFLKNLKKAKAMVLGDKVHFQGNILPLYHMPNTGTGCNIGLWHENASYFISVIVQDDTMIYQCTEKEFKLMDYVVTHFVYPNEYQNIVDGCK